MKKNVPIYCNRVDGIEKYCLNDSKLPQDLTQIIFSFELTLKENAQDYHRGLGKSIITTLLFNSDTTERLRNLLTEKRLIPYDLEFMDLFQTLDKLGNNFYYRSPGEIVDFSSGRPEFFCKWESKEKNFGDQTLCTINKIRDYLYSSKY